MRIGRQVHYPHFEEIMAQRGRTSRRAIPDMESKFDSWLYFSYSGRHCPAVRFLVLSQCPDHKSWRDQT